MTEHSHARSPTQISPVWLNVSRRSVLMFLIAGAVGLISAWIASALTDGGWRRFQLGYLTAFAFVLTLSLGSICFVLLQHVTRAGWSVLIRRPAEIFALNIVTVGVLALPIVWWVQGGELYPWAQADTAGEVVAVHGELSPALDSTADHQTVQHGPSQLHLYSHQHLDELTKSKQGWLNRTGFAVRMAVYFGVWILLAVWMFANSRGQDRATDGSVVHTLRMERAAGPGIILFGFTLTFAAFDWLMSLDPHWYSTMFGVYVFAGCAVGSLAVLLLSVLLGERWGVLPHVLSEEHRRDLGRWLFAFVFFWGYIAFSQYMLIWYAHIPETTRWFVNRGASQAAGYGNSWGWLLIVLLFGHFLIPFLGIMSRHIKAHRGAMTFWTIWLLVMHYLDLYWLIMPESGPDLTLGPIELGLWLAVVCCWLLGASFIATRISLIPTGDPRVAESLRVTEVY